MIRKLVCSMVVLVVAIGFVAAGEYSGTITKVDGGKVSFFTKKTKKDDKKELTLTTAETVKVLEAKTEKDGKKTVYSDGDKIEGGLKASVFSKIDDKGVAARIYTDGEGDKETITKILVIKSKK